MSKIVFENSLGTIDEEYFFLRNKLQNISFKLSDVEATSVIRKRNWPIALLGFAMALALLIAAIFAVFSGHTAVLILFVPLFAFSFFVGLASWLGHHEMRIQLNNGQLKTIPIKMSKISEGEQLYRELREAVFGEVNQEV